MKRKSTERMDLIKNTVESFYETHYRKPAISEIGKETGLVKSTVHRYLKEMNENGMLQYDGKSLDTKKTLKIKKAFVNVGVCNKLPLGTATEQEEIMEEYVPLPVAIFGQGDFIILRINDDSMENVRINKGDLIVIRRDIQAESGNVVIINNNGKAEALVVDNFESTANGKDDIFGVIAYVIKNLMSN